MKRFIVLILMLTLVFQTGGSTSAAAGQVEKLGTPHYSIGILNSVVAEGPNGEQAIFAPSNGNPSILNVVEAKTGELLSAHPLTGATQAWGAEVDKKGNVYIAAGANLYKYDRKKDSVINLGKAIEGETTLWHIKSDKKGRIYGGTFPNGKLFMYDPKKDAFTDYGHMAEGEQYGRSVAVYKDMVYVGIGSTAHLIEFNPKTGKKKEISLPDKYANEKFVYDLDVERDHLFARVTDSSTLLVYDLKRKKWVDEITGVKGVKVSPAGPKNLIYFNKDNQLYSYDVKKHKLTNTGFSDTWSNKGFGWIELDEPGFKGKSLVSVVFNGNYWVYNPKSGQHKTIQAQMEGQPIGLQSIGTGPDGSIYTSGYLSGGFARFNPADGKMTSFSGFGQAENMISTNDYLYLGVYAGGEIYRYDPDLPYNFDATNPAAATNPKRLFTLKSYGQDRPFGMAQGDGKVFFGTVPDYGKLGGALTVLEEASETYEVYTDIVKDQSVITLAYKDGLVYGATSVSGGLGSTPATSEARLFIFDTATKQKIYEGTPLPGEKAIGALAFDDKGTLWGMSPGKIFSFNPSSRQVTGIKEMFSHNWDGVGHYWRGAFLSYDSSDGQFYGTTLGKLFSFNPQTQEHKVLDSNAALFAKDFNGNLYFGRGTDLYRYVK